jgi:hypothetical protein
MGNGFNVKREIKAAEDARIEENKVAKPSGLLNKIAHILSFKWLF